MNSHIFTNKNGNTLMREIEGVLSDNPSIKNLDAMVGFLRASGYDSDEKLVAYFFPQNSRGDVKAKFDKIEDAGLLDFITSKYKLYNSL